MTFCQISSFVKLTYGNKYKCIDSSLNLNSSFYFSRCYNSPNFYKSISLETKSKLTYGYFPIFVDSEKYGVTRDALYEILKS